MHLIRQFGSFIGRIAASCVIIPIECFLTLGLLYLFRHRRRRIKVTGRVRDVETGAGIPDARVKLRSYFRVLMNNYDEQHETRTDESGRFEFSDLMVRRLVNGDRYTSLRIEASQHGYTVDTIDCQLDSLRDQRDFDLRLSKSGQP